MAAEEENKCECDKRTCPKHTNNGVCSDTTCKEYKSCCEPRCEGCKVNQCDKGKCKCRILRCGCQEDCYAKADGKCKGKEKNDCKRCETKCKTGEPCICYRCSCGPRCNGVICSCCSWCDPRNCSGGKCDGYVIGRCEGSECKGHVRYEGDPVWDRKQEIKIKCDRNSHEGDCIDGKCNKWLRGERDKNGNCVIKCTYCGNLCSQDWCRIWLGVLIIGLIILSCFIVMWGMFPETFQKMKTGIRAAFTSSPRDPGRPLSNLIGDKSPAEMNIDRYPAFRPRAYAGLA